MNSRNSMALGLALLMAAGLTHAQGVYKIVGPDGKVTFSDKPPANAQGSGAGTIGLVTPGGNPAGADLPYELRQATSKYPLTLYTSTQCAPCDTARSMLKARGIPFNEKTVTTAQDGEALQRLSGDTNLPYATLGAQKLHEYAETEWAQYLDAAGYPKTSILPKSYRYPAATPLVAVKSAEPAKAEAAPKPAKNTAPPAPAPSNPAGITF